MTYSRSRLALTEDDNDGNCGDLLRLTALSLSQYFPISLKLFKSLHLLILDLHMNGTFLEAVFLLSWDITGVAQIAQPF